MRKKLSGKSQARPWTRRQRSQQKRNRPPILRLEGPMAGF